MTIDIDPLDDAGLRVTDHIDNAQFELYTADSVCPRATDGEEHYFPVDASVRIDTDEVVVPRVASVIVHDAEGRVVSEGSDLSLPPGTYHVEIGSAPTKTYFRVDGSMSAMSSAETTRLRFDDRRFLSAGFRSFNERPAGTITTPTDPESVMDAVSLLGSSLATTSPERSFPTLRGHPPLIEPAEEFTVPDTVTPVDSDVRIVVPPEHRYVYAVASLAHYLAADVVPGSSPRIEGNGWEYPLDPEFERRVSEVLRQTFHLDCLVRTEGFYPVELHERRAFPIDVDHAELYDLPLAARLERYLEIPFSDVEPHLPQWSLTTDVRPDPEHVSVLPYVADDLSLVRCPTRETESAAPEPDHVSEFLRAPTAGDGSPRGGFVRSPPDSTTRTVGGSRSGFTDADEEFVQPDEVETVEHVWVGEGVPLGANKATLEGYRRRLEHDAPERDHISVTVVCNDEQMREEGDVANLYGLRDMLQFEIDVQHDLTRAEMRELLASDVDFLHYIGHVDDRGMQCLDGFLDLSEEDLEVGVRAFLLNACRSFRQGQAMVDAGSRGGIVTLSDVANDPATRLGRIVARLLNGGFNLRSALHVAQRALITGHQYSVLGDGGTTLCQSRSGIMSVIEIQPNDGRYDINVTTFPNGPYDIGSLAQIHLDTFDEYCLVPSGISINTNSKEVIRDFLDLEVLPIFIDNELYWSDEELPL